MQLTRQRTIDLDASPSPRRPRHATGAKWSWSDDELAAMQRAGIDPTHHATHSLRKTSARKMMETTQRLDYVRDWLGHRSSPTTDAYLRSDNTERLKLASQMSEFLRPLAEVAA